MLFIFIFIASERKRVGDLTLWAVPDLLVWNPNHWGSERPWLGLWPTPWPPAPGTLSADVLNDLHLGYKHTQTKHLLFLFCNFRSDAHSADVLNDLHLGYKHTQTNHLLVLFCNFTSDAHSAAEWSPSGLHTQIKRLLFFVCDFIPGTLFTAVVSISIWAKNTHKSSVCYSFSVIQIWYTFCSCAKWSLQYYISHSHIWLLFSFHCRTVCVCVSVHVLLGD